MSAFEFVTPSPDDDEVTPCRISGWMPWLPPTPAPTGGPVLLRDLQGRLERPAYLPRTVHSGANDTKRAQVRRVVHELPGRMPGGEHVYTLDCGHKAYRRIAMTHTRCVECPRLPKRAR